MLKLAVILGMLSLAAPSIADEVRFPLTVDYEILQRALRKHLHEESKGELVFWGTADGCRSFTLRDPTVEPAEGRLKIAGRGSARLGFALFGLCFAQMSWDGQVDIVARPEIGRDWQIRLRDLDTQLYDAERRPHTVARRVWNLVKEWDQSELLTFTFDLGLPVEDIRALLGLFAEPGTAPLRAALQTLRPSGLAVEPDGLKVGVVMDVPRASQAPRAPEPALTPAELARWQTRLDNWDGFLVFVVKDFGVMNADPAVRSELLDVLVTARHDLVAILSRGPEAGVDPLPGLFLSTWNRLRAIARRTALQSRDDNRALRYVTFLAAGDALAAISATAPAAGLDISADGLRRLARVLDPTFAGDPLEYSPAPDEALKDIFRFRDPDAPPRRARRRPPSGWHWFTPRPVYAQMAVPDDWAGLAKRLDRWVPARGELRAYRDTVSRLLLLAAERSFDSELLDERFDDLYQNLVKTTAWQESCWRQFVRKGTAVTYLFSSTGDVGLMQINVRIWRGFFNPDKLRWNAAYNAGAGAEILVHLLMRYGTREATERLENAARATYSAYNGGPSRYRRYRLARAPAPDRGFWEKYQLVASGEGDTLALCLGPRALLDSAS